MRQSPAGILPQTAGSSIDKPCRVVYIPDMRPGEQIAVQPRLPSVEILTAAVEDLRFWHWDQDGLPYWRLYWNDRPGCYIDCETFIELDSRHVVLVAPHTPTRLRQRHSAGHLFLHFTVSPPLHHPRQCVWRFRLAPAAVPEMRDLFSAIAGHTPADQLSLPLLSLIARQLQKIPAADWQQHPMDQRIHQATLWIERGLAVRLSVDALAQRVGMSTAAFARLFRNTIGISPHQYILRRRIDAAAMRLGNSLDSIDQIAADCGFCDRYHLTRAFKHSRGIGPAAFRRERG